MQLVLCPYAGNADSKASAEMQTVILPSVGTCTNETRDINAVCWISCTLCLSVPFPPPRLTHFATMHITTTSGLTTRLVFIYWVTRMQNLRTPAAVGNEELSELPSLRPGVDRSNCSLACVTLANNVPRFLTQFQFSFITRSCFSSVLGQRVSTAEKQRLGVWLRLSALAGCGV